MRALRCVEIRHSIVRHAASFLPHTARNRNATHPSGVTNEKQKGRSCPPPVQQARGHTTASPELFYDEVYSPRRQYNTIQGNTVGNTVYTKNTKSKHNFMTIEHKLSSVNTFKNSIECVDFTQFLRRCL